MPVFAKILLVTTLCTPGGDGKDSCQLEAPESWISTSIVEAGKDWETCTKLKAVYLAKPGIKSAKCQYADKVGAAS